MQILWELREHNDDDCKANHHQQDFPYDLVLVFDGSLVLETYSRQLGTDESEMGLLELGILTSLMNHYFPI